MVASVSTQRVVLKDLRLDVLPRATQRAFALFVESDILRGSPWYLAGGTALGLQVGHRRSVDLDFFCPERDFDTARLSQDLGELGDWETTLERKGTLYGNLMKTQISFIAYPFFVPAGPKLLCGSVRLLMPEDIAVMKIIALSQRGRKRDFVDVYWYCRNRESLNDIVPRVLKQYPGQTHNMPHILKSLTFFDDAEKDPMPELFFSADWKTVRKYFQEEVPKLAKKILT